MAKSKTRSKYGGKVIDTWYYQYVGIDTNNSTPENPENEDDESDSSIRKSLQSKAGQIKVPINVFIHKKFEESDKPPMATKEVYFSLECDNPEFAIKGSDIESLRVAMWERLDTHFAIKWERYYKVQITSGYYGTGLNFEYDSIEKGTAWDGTLLLREFNSGSSSRVIRPWPGDFRDSDGRVLACIPNTAENTRALQEFGVRIHELRKKLAGFLSPKVIMATLQNLNSIALLSRNSQQDAEDSDDGECGHLPIEAPRG